MENDKAIPVIRLEEQLEMLNDEQEASHLVFVTIEGKTYALAVDSIIRQQEIVIQELGSEISNNNIYLGAAIMGDGSITLILDTTTICLERNRLTND